MAWVRYDDQFHNNAKVTAVILDDPGAIALHTLGNTWTNSQPKHKGFIPEHQPAALLCDRELGPRWAAVLVRRGLWHERDKPCQICVEEYADVPAEAVGYIVHNAEEYRPPARDRVVAGTPVSLSEKRRESGRKGGRTTADRRKQDNDKQSQANEATTFAAQANTSNEASETPELTAMAGTEALWDVSEVASPAKTPRQRQANSASKSSNLLLAGVSPVPVPGTTPASNEAGTQQPDEPTTTQRAFGVGRDWIKHRADSNTPVVAKGKTDPVIILRRLIEPFVEKGYTDTEIKKALKEIGESIPTTSQMDRTLTRLREGKSGHMNGGGYRGRSEIESNAPKRIPAGERCPTHPSYRAETCGACRSERVAAGQGR